jgi:hypothetical protein
MRERPSGEAVRPMLKDDTVNKEKGMEDARRVSNSLTDDTTDDRATQQTLIGPSQVCSCT